VIAKNWYHYGCFFAGPLRSYLDIKASQGWHGLPLLTDIFIVHFKIPSLGLRDNVNGLRLVAALR
jgi:hypothetical protein